MRESEVENHFCWQVEMCGGLTWKTKAIGRPGFPDRIACMPNGEMWLVELKAPKGRLSTRQIEFAENMKALKQRYVALWTIPQIDAWAEGRVFTL